MKCRFVADVKVFLFLEATEPRRLENKLVSPVKGEWTWFFEWFSNIWMIFIPHNGHYLVFEPINRSKYATSYDLWFLFVDLSKNKTLFFICCLTASSWPKFVRWKKPRRSGTAGDTGRVPGRSTVDNPRNKRSSNYSSGNPEVICIHFILVLRPCCERMNHAKSYPTCILLESSLFFRSIHLSLSEITAEAYSAVKQDLLGISWWFFFFERELANPAEPELED